MISVSTEEAERLIVSAVLRDNTAMDCLCALTGAHFSNSFRGALFDEMVRLARTHGGVTIGAIEPWASAQGVDWPTLTAFLSGAAPAQRVIPSLEAVILKAAQVRTIEGVCRDVLARIEAGEAEPDALCTALEQASQSGVAPDGGANALTLWREVVDDLGKEFRPKCKSGLMAFDRMMGGLFEGDLIILGGRPSMGKTSIATNIAVNAAKGGSVVHFASCEMSGKRLLHRIGSRLSNAYDYSDMLRPGRRPTAETVWTVEERLPATLHIVERAAQTIAFLRASLRATRQLYGRVDLFIVDHMHIMGVEGSRVENRNRDLAHLSAGLKAIAMDFGIPVIALAQLSRGIEGREDKRPALSDLRESGAIEQDADAVMFAYREAYYLERNEPELRDGEKSEKFQEQHDKWRARLDVVKNQVDLIVSKNRNGEIGTLRFRFHAARDTVTDLPYIHGEAA